MQIYELGMQNKEKEKLDIKRKKAQVNTVLDCNVIPPLRD